MALSRRDRVAEDVVKYFCQHGVSVNGVTYKVKVTSKIPNWKKVLGSKDIESDIKKDTFPSGGISLRIQEILVHPETRGVGRLIILLHEFLHGLDMRLNEDTIDKIAQFFAGMIVDSIIRGYSKSVVLALLECNLALPPDEWKEPLADAR